MEFEGFTPISSSHIHSVKYDPIQRKMRVRFQNGDEHTVHGFDPTDYQEFMDAPSQGTHWHRVIKNNFAVERMK